MTNEKTPTRGGMQGPGTRRQHSTAPDGLTPERREVYLMSLARAFQIGPEQHHRRELEHGVAELIVHQIDPTEGTMLRDIVRAANEQGISRGQVRKALDDRLSGPLDAVSPLDLRPITYQTMRLIRYEVDGSQMRVHLTACGRFARQYLEAEGHADD